MSGTSPEHQPSSASRPVVQQKSPGKQPARASRGETKLSSPPKTGEDDAKTTRAAVTAGTERGGDGGAASCQTAPSSPTKTRRPGMKATGSPSIDPLGDVKHSSQAKIHRAKTSTSGAWDCPKRGTEAGDVGSETGHMTQRRSSLVDDDGSMEKAPEQTAEEKDDDNDDEEDHHRRQGDSGRGSLSNESRDSGSFKSGKDRISPASECSNSAEFTSSVDSVRSEPEGTSADASAEALYKFKSSPVTVRARSRTLSSVSEVTVGSSVDPGSPVDTEDAEGDLRYRSASGGGAERSATVRGGNPHCQYDFSYHKFRDIYVMQPVTERIESFDELTERFQTELKEERALERREKNRRYTEATGETSSPEMPPSPHEAKPGRESATLRSVNPTQSGQVPSQDVVTVGPDQTKPQRQRARLYSCRNGDVILCRECQDAAGTLSLAQISIACPDLSSSFSSDNGGDIAAQSQYGFSEIAVSSSPQQHSAYKAGEPSTGSRSPRTPPPNPNTGHIKTPSPQLHAIASSDNPRNSPSKTSTGPRFTKEGSPNKGASRDNPNTGPATIPRPHFQGLASSDPQTNPSPNITAASSFTKEGSPKKRDDPNTGRATTPSPHPHAIAPSHPHPNPSSRISTSSYFTKEGSPKRRVARDDPKIPSSQPKALAPSESQTSLSSRISTGSPSTKKDLPKKRTAQDDPKAGPAVPSTKEEEAKKRTASKGKAKHLSFSFSSSDTEEGAHSCDDLAEKLETVRYRIAFDVIKRETLGDRGITGRPTREAAKRETQDADDEEEIFYLPTMPPRFYKANGPRRRQPADQTPRSPDSPKGAVPTKHRSPFNMVGKSKHLAKQAALSAKKFFRKSRSLPASPKRSVSDDVPDDRKFTEVITYGSPQLQQDFCEMSFPDKPGGQRAVTRRRQKSSPNLPSWLKSAGRSGSATTPSSGSPRSDPSSTPERQFSPRTPSSHISPASSKPQTPSVDAGKVSQPSSPSKSNQGDSACFSVPLKSAAQEHPQNRNLLRVSGGIGSKSTVSSSMPGLSKHQGILKLAEAPTRKQSPPATPYRFEQLAFRVSASEPRSYRASDAPDQEPPRSSPLTRVAGPPPFCFIRCSACRIPLPFPPSERRNEALERLCHAIQNKETPLDHVSLLVEGLSASELNTPSQDFQLTPLMIAAIAKRCDVVEVLLQKGAHPDVPTESHVMLTALLLACCHSCVCADVMSVVRVLRWWGADLNVQDIHGCTPLCFAMERGNKELISYLLKHGAMKTDDHDHPSQQHH